jgi:4-hydroxybenzoate polyprenyltransferase
MMSADRWWVYQRERFPVFAHAPVILAFSLSAISYSALLRGATSLPGWKPCFVAFLSSLLTFFQLRIADEFKDFEEDSRYRPYRPVPRGLVTLRQLAWVWAACMAIQLLMALWLSPHLVVLLVATWIYLGLMTREFFAKRWLKARPVVYMVSHMAIMPLVDFYAAACDWVPLGRLKPAPGLMWFLLVSLFNGMVIEIGRKIRVPEDEEKGVETYSFLWGRNRAVAVWLAMMTVTGILACRAAQNIGFFAGAMTILAVTIAMATVLSVRFLATRAPGAGKRLETMAGVWSLLLYLSLGVLPIALRFWRRT